jgi:PadR family transcriptional regulator AphA
MDIEYAILGLLGWQSLSGYDLKKIIAESDVFYWSGNNNQIYNSLVHLLRQGLVSQQVELQESLPPRKVYSLTESGRQALLTSALADPELPELHHNFLIQLAWTDQLPEAELDALLAKYEEEIQIQALMRQRLADDRSRLPCRTPRERLLWDAIQENLLSFYRRELEWVRGLRQSLHTLGQSQG